MAIKTIPTIRLIASVLLSAALTLAAVAKLSDFQMFITYLSGINPLPKQLVPVLAVALPSFELALAFGYQASPCPKFVRWLGVWTFAIFLLFQISTAIPGLHVTDSPCACFGRLFPETGKLATYLRGIGLLLLSLFHAQLHSSLLEKEA